jgi:hypothetical protein
MKDKLPNSNSNIYNLDRDLEINVELPTLKSIKILETVFFANSKDIPTKILQDINLKLISGENYIITDINEKKIAEIKTISKIEIDHVEYLTISLKPISSFMSGDIAYIVDKNNKKINIINNFCIYDIPKYHPNITFQQGNTILNCNKLNPGDTLLLILEKNLTFGMELNSEDKRITLDSISCNDNQYIYKVIISCLFPINTESKFKLTYYKNCKEDTIYKINIIEPQGLVDIDDNIIFLNKDNNLVFTYRKNLTYKKFESIIISFDNSKLDGFCNKNHGKQHIKYDIDFYNYKNTKPYNTSKTITTDLLKNSVSKTYSYELPNEFIDSLFSHPWNKIVISAQHDTSEYDFKIKNDENQKLQYTIYYAVKSQPHIRTSVNNFYGIKSDGVFFGGAFLDITYGLDLYKNEKKIIEHGINKRIFESVDVGIFGNGKIDLIEDSLKGKYGDYGFILKCKFNFLNFPGDNETKSNDFTIQPAIGYLIRDNKFFFGISLGLGLSIIENGLKTKL